MGIFTQTRSRLTACAALALASATAGYLSASPLNLAYRFETDSRDAFIRYAGVSPAEPPARPVRAAAGPGMPRTPAAVSMQGACGFSGTMLVLFLGTDEREEIPYGADVIRFINIDFDRPGVTCVALSRDLLVKTPSLADRHITESRLGEIFDRVQTGTKGMPRDAQVAATAAVRQAIYDNFGIATDHYLTVPESSFAALVDSLGGIEVDVPQDQAAYGYVIRAGRRTLDGRQALAYIRLFEGYGPGDFGRNSRQLPFIKSVLARMVEPANLVKMPGIIGRLQDGIATDVGPAEMAGLLCMLGRVPRENIAFYSLQPEMTRPGPNDTLVPDAPKIAAWLRRLLTRQTGSGSS